LTTSSVNSVKTRLPIEQKYGHAEFHAELSCEAIFGAVVNQSVGKVSIGADSNPFHLVRYDVVFLNQTKHLRHTGMRKGSRGEWLNGNTWRNERPGLAELIHDGRGIEPSTLRLEESTRRFQDLVRSGPSQPCKVRGNHSALGSPSCMQRLRHGAEIFAQAGGFAGADSERGQYARPIESVDLDRGRRGPERANGSGAMESVFIVPRGNCFCNLALYLNPDVIGDQEILSRDRFDLSGRQGRGKHRCCGVGQQAIDPILRNGKLGIVVIVSVDTDSIGKGRKSHWSSQRRANHRGPMPLADTKPLDLR
jgi:hypothetical protein